MHDNTHTHTEQLNTELNSSQYIFKIQCELRVKKFAHLWFKTTEKLFKKSLSEYATIYLSIVNCENVRGLARIVTQTQPAVALMV